MVPKTGVLICFGIPMCWGCFGILIRKRLNQNGIGKWHWTGAIWCLYNRSGYCSKTLRFHSKARHPLRISQLQIWLSAPTSLPSRSECLGQSSPCSRHLFQKPSLRQGRCFRSILHMHQKCLFATEGNGTTLWGLEHLHRHIDFAAWKQYEAMV